MNNTLQLQLLHLSLIQNVGLLSLKKVYTHLTDRSIDLYSLSSSDFVSWGIDSKTATTLVEGLADNYLLEKELSLIEKHAISWTTLLDSEYPALLAHTHVAPLVLYWQGSAVWNDGCSLSVVGSRAATDYGRRAIINLIIPCVKRGMIIVSGGALGIDSMAHEAALNHNGKTVVVLGTGLLKPYPAQNKKLFEAIAFSGGAVMSCFPLEMIGNSWQFPVRNRIIAGMTRGCFVVQAAEKSGALITAKYALDEGRNVYALPGQFDDDLSVGCNKLLQQGAQVVLSAQDILQDYGIDGADVQQNNEDREAQKSVFSKESPLKTFLKKIVTPTEKKAEKQEELTGLLVHCSKPISLEQLIELSEKSEAEISQELFLLQLEGKIEQDFAGFWCIK